MADNIDEEPLENPIASQSKNPSDEILPTQDTETINSTQKPSPFAETLEDKKENMEVHHHSNHEGKKNWKSYFWEFLILFLAVFCGFLAENIRESSLERHKEK